MDKSNKILEMPSSIRDLHAMRNNMIKQISIIDRLISNSTEKPIKKFSCPHCGSYDIRINLENVYCRRCGERSERIGDRVLK
jgi:hypothetical protein